MSTNPAPRRRRRRRRQRTSAGIWALGALALALLALCTVLLLRSGPSQEQGTAIPTATPGSAATPQPDDPDGAASGLPETPEEPEDALAQAMATAGSNATKDPPQVTDPSTWNERGKALMDALCADPTLAAAGINVAQKDGFPYLLAVNCAACTVTVYTPDEEGRYTVPFMAMVCSGGSDTPTGFWSTPVSYDWRLLYGPCYGQYATRIWDAYLFHSVPYYTQHKDDLEYDQFNQLGTIASLGCIRLAVVDVKWIYDNCPIGTPVIIYNDAEDPGPMGKPGTIYTDPTDEAKRGWDPTDPDPSNPWPAAYRTGTAIRSQAAWAQWDEAQADGRWATSLTPTDLQGWSTDSTLEGTRG